MTQDEAAQLKAAQQSRQRWMKQALLLKQAIQDIDFTLRVGAAEYVPAIQDAFAIIDKVQKKTRRDADA